MKMKQFSEIPEILRILKKNIISTVAKKESSLKIENTKEEKDGAAKNRNGGWRRTHILPFSFAEVVVVVWVSHIYVTLLLQRLKEEANPILTVEYIVMPSGPYTTPKVTITYMQNHFKKTLQLFNYIESLLDFR